MLYKTETRPGLVALYHIRPGNGAGQFLQPRSPHGATGRQTRRVNTGSIYLTPSPTHIKRERNHCSRRRYSWYLSFL